MVAREAITSLTFDARPAEAGASQFERAAQKIIAANGNVTASTERVATGSAGFERTLNSAINRLDPYSKALNQLAKDHATLQRGVDLFTRSSGEAGISQERATSLYDTAKEKLAGMAERMLGAGAAAELSAVQYSRLARHAKSAAVEISEGNFGGAAASLGGIAAHLSELGIGFAAAGAGAVAMVGALSLGILHANEMNSEIRKLDVALGAMGNSAGVSAADLRGLAGDLEKLGVGREAALEGIAEIVRTGEFTGEQIRETATLAADAAARYGTSYQAAQQKVIAVSEKGYSAIKSLDESWHFLTATQLENIRTMSEHGQSAEAVEIAIGALRTRVDGAARDSMTPMGKAVADLAESWRKLLDAFAQSAAISSVVTGLTAIVGAMSWIIEHAPQAGPGIGAAIESNPQLGAAIAIGRAATATYKALTGPVELGRSGDIALPPASTFPEGGSHAGEGGASRTESTAAIQRQQKIVDELALAAAHESEIASASLGIRDQVRARIEAETFALQNNLTGEAAQEAIRIKVGEAVLKQTTAVRDQTAALRLNIAETERATAAFGISLSAGLIADAQRQAALEHQRNPSVDIGARTRELLGQQAATGAEQAARDLQNTGLDVRSLGGVAAAGGNPASVRAAERAAEAERQFRQPIAAAQASVDAGGGPQAQAGLDLLLRERSALQDLLALRERENLQIKSNDELRQLSQAVEEKRLEASLIGQSVDTRERELALLKLRNQLINEGFEGPQLDAEIAKRQALTGELAKYNAAIERNNASEKAFDQVVKQGANDLANDITNFLDGTLKANQILPTLLKQADKLATEFFITKPLQTFIDKDLGSSVLKGIGGSDFGDAILSAFGIKPAPQYAQAIGPGLPGSPDAASTATEQLAASKALTDSAVSLKSIPNILTTLLGKQLTSEIYVTAATAYVSGAAGGGEAGGALSSIPFIGQFLGGGSGSAGGGLDPSFIGGSADAGASTFAPSAAFFSYHRGGLVGSDGAPGRAPLSTFIRAPRFHDGFAPDEIPAVLQVGERVLSRRETAAFNAGAAASGGSSRSGGRSRPAPNVIMNIQTADPSSFGASSRQIAAQYAKAMDRASRRYS